MRADERETAAARLRQIAGEAGLELGSERLEGMMRLLESTVDGVRAAGELGLEATPPALVPNLDRESEP